MKCTSPILSNMSGKLGGAVASRARGGIQYFRELVTPTNPNTMLQQAARNAITSASAYWKGVMDDATRELWWDAAEGAQTGQSIFTTINQPRFFANTTGRETAVASGIIPLPVITAPPASLATVYSGSTIIIDDSANQLTITPNDENDPFLKESDEAESKCGVLYVFVSHEQVSSRLSRQHPYQFARAFVYGDDVATAQTINLATLGMTTVAGEVMYVKHYVQLWDGATSTPIEERITIVA